MGLFDSIADLAGGFGDFGGGFASSPESGSGGFLGNILGGVESVGGLLEDVQGVVSGVDDLFGGSPVVPTVVVNTLPPGAVQNPFPSGGVFFPGVEADDGALEQVSDSVRDRMPDVLVAVGAGLLLFLIVKG